MLVGDYAPQFGMQTVGSRHGLRSGQSAVESDGRGLPLTDIQEHPAGFHGDVEAHASASDAMEGEVFRRVPWSPFPSLVAWWRCEWAALVQGFLIFTSSRSDRRVTAAVCLSSVVEAKATSGGGLEQGGCLRLVVVVGGKREEICLRLLESALATRWEVCIVTALGRISHHRLQGRHPHGTYVPECVVMQEMEARREELVARIDAAVASARSEQRSSAMHWGVAATRRCLARVAAARLRSWLHKARRAGDDRWTGLVVLAHQALHLWHVLLRVHTRWAHIAFQKLRDFPRRSGSAAFRGYHLALCERVGAPGRCKPGLRPGDVLRVWWRSVFLPTLHKPQAADGGDNALATHSVVRQGRISGLHQQGLASASPCQLERLVARARSSLAFVVWGAWRQNTATNAAQRAVHAMDRQLCRNQFLLQDALSIPLELAVRALDRAVRRALMRRLARSLAMLAASAASARTCTGTRGGAWRRAGAGVGALRGVRDASGPRAAALAQV
mmetsp:Transcript_31528/g.86835  ORF Transcript_31528/g.86835 Transcript_31528/m.86835 type:complete len:501 (+) Transcript_31528:191-1693(+)